MQMDKQVYCQKSLTRTFWEARLLQQAAAKFFFFNDTATTEIYTLSLHDALPIGSFTTCEPPWPNARHPETAHLTTSKFRPRWSRDRKSTRLNSSHVKISYAVFCLKKKKKKNYELTHLTTKKKQRFINS